MPSFWKASAAEKLHDPQNLLPMNGQIVLGFSVLTFLIVDFSAADQMAQNTPSRRLAAENASAGLFPGMNHLFTIPNYWDYGNFKPRDCVELPGNFSEPWPTAKSVVRPF